MILTINIRNKSLYCLVTTNIRTVSIINNSNLNPVVNITMNFESYVDDMKIYTESIDECQQIYDRIVYCINKPTEAIMFSKEYLRIGCHNTEEDSDE